MILNFGDQILSMQDAARIKSVAKDILPTDVKIMIVSHGATVTIVRGDTQGEPA